MLKLSIRITQVRHSGQLASFSSVDLLVVYRRSPTRLKARCEFGRPDHRRGVDLDIRCSKKTIDIHDYWLSGMTTRGRRGDDRPH
jgi:hypothetical protein